MKKQIIGVMGPGGGASEDDLIKAEALGRGIALRGWVLLTGGRDSGVMAAASRGAQEEEGLVVGILPGPDDAGISPHVDLAIHTDLGHARNNVNVLSSDLVIACGMGLGTVSEIALAAKNGKRVLVLTEDSAALDFLTDLAPDRIEGVDSPEEALATAAWYLANHP